MPGAEGHDALLIRLAELERANVDLQRSNADLREFASVAAHELRAPLQTVIGFAELLDAHAGSSLDEEAAEYLHDIRRGAVRLEALVEGLLAYARIGTSPRRREEVRCDLVLDEVCEALAIPIAEAGATLVFDQSLPVLVGDWSELTQVFQNLVTNALAYRRDGFAPVIRITGHRLEEGWQITVEDNGRGIDPQYRDRLFRLFQRLPGSQVSAGSGIGLAMCKRIVEGHGGCIWAEDVPGASGTRLCFTIPVAACWNPF